MRQNKLSRSADAGALSGVQGIRRVGLSGSKAALVLPRSAAWRAWNRIEGGNRALALQLAAALIYAAGLTLAFPSPDHGWLAWIALAPLLLVCRDLPASRAFAIGLVAGAASAYGIYNWLLVVPAFGALQAIVLDAYVALYPALWCAALPLLARGRVPLIVTAPALWVVLDYLRSHAGFLALPWATLAHTQHDNLAVLQLASLTGEAGIIFLVVMVNVALADLLAKRNWRTALIAVVTVAAVHIGGALALASADEQVRISVAAIQPSIGLAERDSVAGREAIWQRLERLTLAAAKSRPAVIVWPETAVGDPRNDPELGERLAALARAARTPLIVGAAETEKFASPNDQGMVLRQRGAHNSAYLIVAEGLLDEPYRKRRLVPFGEYLPLAGIFTWPRWLVPEILVGKAGDSDRQWTLPDGVRVAALICWENLFAGLARESVQNGAQVLVQLTNDTWFGHTAAAAQHNLASVLRAVENRTPVVIASNTGPSQIIDGYGRVLSRVPSLSDEGIARAEMPYAARGTLYTEGGDVLMIAMVAIVLLALILGRRTVFHAPPQHEGRTS